MNHNFNQLTNDLIESLKKERAGELSKNGSRLSKGMYLTLLEREGIKLKAAGQGSELTPLQSAITHAKNALENMGIFDTNLSDDEVSIVRKTYVRVAEPLGGVDATFTDHFAINPHTGMKLVNDGGMPYVRPISEVAVNKLYLISDYADHDLDASISFAKRATEKGLKKFNKLWKSKRDPNAMFSAMADLVEGPGVTDETITEYVNDALGVVESGPEYKNIQVPAHVYDGVYNRVRQMMSLILGFNGNSELLDKASGEVMPGIMLETILVTLMEPLEYGPWNVLETLLRSETITAEQAANFKLAWDSDGLAERWEEVMKTGKLPTFAEHTGDESPF